jgi:Zn-dependent protease with chaperone function
MNAWALVIATAIPVVMFALWVEYFRQDWESPDNPERDAEGGPEGAITRIRLAGLLGTSLQLVIFLAMSPMRQEDSVAGAVGLWVALAGLVAQRVMQARLETSVIQSAPRSETLDRIASSGGRILGTQMIWAFAGVVVYLGMLGLGLGSTAVLIAYFKLSGWKALAALGAGTLLGYSLALASNFVLSPWFMRRMIPGGELPGGELRSQITRWFEESQTQPPEMRVTEMQLRGMANAWVTGLAWMRGPFRPVLWLSPALVSTLTASELEAVIKHEIVHLRQNHLTQRFVLAWSMSLLVLVTLASALGLAALLPPQHAGPVLPAFSIFLAAALVWGSLKAIEEQAHLHELEADARCITELGARPSSLAAALHKVAAINGDLPSRTHPTLIARLKALEPLLEKELRRQASAEASDDDDFSQAA